MKYRSKVKLIATALKNIFKKKLDTRFDDCRYHSLLEMDSNAKVDVIWDVKFYDVSREI